MKLLSYVQLFAIPWTVAYQAPLSMEFSRQDYLSGLPLSPPRDLPYPRIEPVSPVFPALAGRLFTTTPPGKLIYSLPNISLVCVVISKEFYMKQLSKVVKMIILYSAWLSSRTQEKNLFLASVLEQLLLPINSVL